MSSLRVLALLLCVLPAGCRLASQGQSDEQKDPYFLAGKNRLQDRDYQGAIDMFEKALDVNPRSASAHFELGILYEQQQADYAAALYHYQRAVTVNSNMPFTELGRQRIQECKRELAKSVVQPLSMEKLQRDLDNARAEIQTLKEQLQAWQNFYAGRGITLSNLPPAATISASHATTPGAEHHGSAAHAAHDDAVPQPAPVPAVTRVHKIVSGDTPASIARKYNIKLSALQLANPHMEPRRLRPGQTLAIPAP